VHLLDNSSHAVRRLKNELAEAEDIRQRNSSLDSASRKLKFPVGLEESRR
jgi:cell shape-determining protein MreC